MMNVAPRINDLIAGFDPEEGGMTTLDDSVVRYLLEVARAVERAGAEGRNVLPSATDDDAATIEAWAATVLAGMPL